MKLQEQINRINQSNQINANINNNNNNKNTTTTATAAAATNNNNLCDTGYVGYTRELKSTRELQSETT